MPNFWALSDIQLAKSCVLVAESHAGQTNPAVKGEAERLFLLWHDAINGRDEAGPERERRAALLSGLRKRTIQILVKLSLDEGAIPAR